MRSAIWSLLLSLLILQVQVVSAAQEGQQSGQTPAPAVKADLPPDTPVITINGLCASELMSGDLTALLNHGAATSPAGKGIDPSCKTVVTLQQYLQLVAAAGGKSKPGNPPNFARQYIEKLIYATKAREAGNDKEPGFQDKLRYAYVQNLSISTLIEMQRQAVDITDADTEKYFQEHPERFVRMHLQQISIPKRELHGDESPLVPAKPNPVEQEEMHQLALKFQKEAAAGGNIDKLEAKAYKAAHNDSVPDTDLGEPVAEEVPPEFRKLIFDLQPGQVSAVVENDHEYLIYKCVDRHTVPPEERRKLYGWLRMRDAKQALQDVVQTQFNPQYFQVPSEKGQ
jgi:PPIC-type PPIASE domain